MRYIARTGPLDYRGNRILVLPPARKGRQGRDMTDICALHPSVKAQNRPSNGEKIKNILLLSTLCSFFANRYKLDEHEIHAHTKRDLSTTDHIMFKQKIIYKYVSLRVP